ncbi:vWA domain-containing protein [Indioceanicola profundi]|uniref:VWA domain-containing protein n=1 Tax=Indioceanicola profundi TaxID=2220096 RepID=UPI001CEDA838|nr:VWA domain-containing protein [Indioceanicola profundi]
MPGPAIKAGDRSSTPPAAAGTGGDVAAFLSKVAAMPPPSRSAGTKGRLIFALDATASRQPTWDRAQHIQGEMFEAAAGLGGLEVQLVFYRGFGECKASPWVGDAGALLGRMTAVTCLGGQTQIGKVLAHARRQTEDKRVNALIFVGDAMEEDPDHLCHLAGELGLLGVPVFMFHEGGDPVVGNVFRQIAKLSRGAYCPFDSSSAQQLKDLLRAVAVYAAGGRAALQDWSRGRSGAVRLLTSQMD